MRNLFHCGKFVIDCATLKGERIGQTYTWQKVKVWTVLYRSQHGEEVTTKTIRPPLKSRTFKVASKPGRRRFTAVAAKTHLQEVLVVAKAKKGSKVLTEDELEELDELEDVEDDEEEDEDVEDTDSDDEDDEDSDDEEEDDDEDSDEDDDSEEDDDEDDDEEEEPKPKKKGKKGKTTSKSATKKKSSRNKKTDGTIGTAELAEAAGITPRALRMALRRWRKEGKSWAEPNEETGRYEYASLENKDAQRIVKNAKAKAAEATKESLDKVKDKKKSKAGKKGGKASAKKTKKKKAADDDEE